MNIFSALAEGKGRLTETNLSAFLSFLLTPHRAHGLSEAFLRSFLKLTAQATGDSRRFDSLLNGKKLNVEVNLEVRYGIDNDSRTVDVEVKLFEKLDEDIRECHRLIVENKIRPSAAQEQQFNEEFIRALEGIDESTQVTAIFLTPPGDATNLSAEYNKLNLTNDGQHRKAWLRWNTLSSGVALPSIVDLIREMLRQEATAEIEPVSEYTRHTLKAFIQFIDKLMLTDASHGVANREITDVVDESEVSIAGKPYRIVRFANKTIKVIDDSGEEYITKPLLRKIVDEYNLDINLNYTTGREKNTRNLGLEIMRELRKTSLAH